MKSLALLTLHTQGRLLWLSLQSGYISQSTTTTKCRICLVFYKVKKHSLLPVESVRQISYCSLILCTCTYGQYVSWLSPLAISAYWNTVSLYNSYICDEEIFIYYWYTSLWILLETSALNRGKPIPTFAHMPICIEFLDNLLRNCHW